MFISFLVVKFYFACIAMSNSNLLSIDDLYALIENPDVTPQQARVALNDPVSVLDSTSAPTNSSSKLSIGDQRFSYFGGAGKVGSLSQLMHVDVEISDLSTYEDYEMQMGLGATEDPSSRAIIEEIKTTSPTIASALENVIEYSRLKSSGTGPESVEKMHGFSCLDCNSMAVGCCSNRRCQTASLDLMDMPCQSDDDGYNSDNWPSEYSSDDNSNSVMSGDVPSGKT